MEQTQSVKSLLVYVGTYTQTMGHVAGRATGIYVYRMDVDNGALSFVSETPGVENPSFLALHPNGRYLYAVNELGEYAGKPGGSVSAFARDPQSGALTLLNTQPSHGGAPCYVNVDYTGKYVVLTNYAGGNVAMYPVQADGGLGAASDIVQHYGSSVDPQRQTAPYAHSVNIDLDNRYALVADLGIDKVMVYRLDLEQGKLVPNDTPFAPLHAGAGPRHLDFHPKRKYVYVINELDSTLTAFSYQAETGELSEIQTVSTLPEGFTGGQSYCADIHVAPSGEFVYGSNRGHDSIVIFAVDLASGMLSLVGHASTQGKTPRNFAIDPSGTFLLAANQDSSTVVTFRIDQQTGELHPTGNVAQIPTPVCLKFAR